MKDREGRRAGLFAAFAVGVLVSPASVQADAILFESASQGTAGQTTGYSIYSDQFQGARFSISQAAEVTQIGGHMLQDAETTLFGAIVRLSGPTAFPLGSPFDASEVVATTTFHAGFPSSDFLTPLSASLEPGDYALIFGAGWFGSPGNASGLMPDNNTEQSGASFFYWAGLEPRWIDGGSGMRFVVRGESSAVPEPSSLVVLAFELMALIALRQNSTSARRADDVSA